MRRIMIIMGIAACLLLSACTSKSIGIIGGADGPTNIVIGETDKQIPYEKESVRMVNIDGVLYYESGEDSDLEARCGNMDGNFKKSCDIFEVPKNSGESNFESKAGYQWGLAENTIEILIDDDWEIFNKIDTNSDVLKYKYCYILEGTLPNAADDSEYLVLADTQDITFSDAAYKLFGSNLEQMKDIYVLPVIDD